MSDNDNENDDSFIAVYKSEIRTVTAYRCRDGQLFESKSTANAYESMLQRKEREQDFLAFAKARCDFREILADGGLRMFNLTSEHLEALERVARDWKDRYFGYDPHISTPTQPNGPDGPWSVTLTRSSKC